MGWYITVTEEQRSFGLSGNTLLVFALICGYSQKRRGCYYGTIAGICDTLGVSKRTVINILDKLIKSELIEKVEGVIDDARVGAYRLTEPAAKALEKGAETAPNENEIGAKISKKGAKISKKGAETAHNNKEYININNISLSHAREEDFKKPSLEEVAAFCSSRRNGIDPEEFIAHYESNGWMVGKNPMKDWQAAVIKWEKDLMKKGAARNSQKRESVFERNMRVYDEMNGTHFHEQIYNNNKQYDEQ